jgi:hypothetical protein
MKRFDCAGSSGGGFGLRGMATMIAEQRRLAPLVDQTHIIRIFIAQESKHIGAISGCLWQRSAHGEKQTGIGFSHAFCFACCYIGESRQPACKEIWLSPKAGRLFGKQEVYSNYGISEVLVICGVDPIIRSGVGRINFATFPGLNISGIYITPNTHSRSNGRLNGAFCACMFWPQIHYAADYKECNEQDFH